MARRTYRLYISDGSRGSGAVRWCQRAVRKCGYDADAAKARSSSAGRANPSAAPARAESQSERQSRTGVWECVCVCAGDGRRGHKGKAYECVSVRGSAPLRLTPTLPTKIREQAAVRAMTGSAAKHVPSGRNNNSLRWHLTRASPGTPCLANREGGSRWKQRCAALWRPD